MLPPRGRTTAMSLLRHLSRPRQYVCQACVRRQHTLARGERPAKRWDAETADVDARSAAWEEQAGRIRSGAQQSMLSVLEERGFVKDVAGGRQALDWLLTERPIGAYVGVDPTAPSLHVGHLLPLMALYWLYLHGYYTVSLLGGGTVMIGDPSGRTTARQRQGDDVRSLNVACIRDQLRRLWTNVKCLGIKHSFSQDTSRRQDLLDNRTWLQNLTAVDLMRDLGSGMRLGPMLARDSVRLRMESGEGMAISEFSYPLFQAYDWWTMYKGNDVQLQIGGSDQYGNICAGMDAVGHMRKINALHTHVREDDPRAATYGLTTPLLTTSSGEKFGKSAGNAVWLDQHMLNSFDLYQYFLRTPDADTERYLKLFTFLPLASINLLMAQQHKDPSRRIAQHVLAKEIVELAHGALEAAKAEAAHKEAFSHGTTTFSLGVLRKMLNGVKAGSPAGGPSSQQAQSDDRHIAYKKAYATPATGSETAQAQEKEEGNNVITLPLSMLQPGSFPHILHAAGLASSKSEAHRLIAKKGAYVLVPNSGAPDAPTALQWVNIEAGAAANPNHFLVDWEALVLRAGKSKIQVCRVVRDGDMEDSDKNLISENESGVEGTEEAEG